jgi:hypothetical protein
VVYEAYYEERARWFLAHVTPAEYAILQTCIIELERNPFPGPDHRTPLVTPGLPTIPDA